MPARKIRLRKKASGIKATSKPWPTLDSKDKWPNHMAPTPEIHGGQRANQLSTGRRMIFPQNHIENQTWTPSPQDVMKITGITKQEKGQPQEVPTETDLLDKAASRNKEKEQQKKPWPNSSMVATNQRDHRRRKARSLRCCQWCELWSWCCFCFVVIVIILFKFRVISYRCQPRDQNLDGPETKCRNALSPDRRTKTKTAFT